MLGAQPVSDVGGRAHSRARVRGLPTRQIAIGAELEPEHLFRELVAAYLAGAGRISIHQKGGIRVATRAVSESFRARVGEGVSLLDEGSELVLFGFDPVERRSLAITTFRLGERVLELLRAAGEAQAAELTEAEWALLDDPIDRLAWEVHRQVAVRWRQGRPLPNRPDERIDAIGWLEASRALERIGDHAVLIGVHGAHWRTTRPGPTELRLLAEFHRQAFEYVSAALVLLGDPRPGPANAAIDLGEALRATASTLVERLLAARKSDSIPPPLAVVALGWVLHSLERVVAYGQDLVEIALDHGRVPSSAGNSARSPSRAMTNKGVNETG